MITFPTLIALSFFVDKALDRLQVVSIRELPGTSRTSRVCFDHSGSDLVTVGDRTSFFNPKDGKLLRHFNEIRNCNLIPDWTTETFIGIKDWKVFRVDPTGIRDISTITTTYKPTVSDGIVPSIIALGKKSAAVYYAFDGKLFRVGLISGIAEEPYKFLVTTDPGVISKGDLFCAGDGAPRLSLQGKRTPTYVIDPKVYVTHIALCEKTRTIFLTEIDGTFQALNIDSRLRIFRKHLRQPPSALACSPDGSIVALGLSERFPRRDPRYRKNQILFANAKTGAFLQTRKIKTTGVADLAFSPDNSMLAEAERDAPVKVVGISKR